jgi:glutamate-5-semialdehyde dehydrogenase
MALRAKDAARALACIPGKRRADALTAMPDALHGARKQLLDANAQDMEDARRAGVPEPLLKRLRVDDSVIGYMRKRLLEAAALPDPLGRTLEAHVRPSGLRVAKVTVPLGVIGIIYEARPNVTTDAAAVCLKSGNAVILRGGSESLRTNLVLADAMIGAAEAAGLPRCAIQIVDTPDRRAVADMLKLDDCIDVLIPRGGKSLIERIGRESRIPVIKHYDGICHLYIAPDADPAMAAALTVNSKCQRVEVCNALETLLVDADCAADILPVVVRELRSAGVVCRGCPATRAVISDMETAVEEDWSTEYLAPILSVKVVSGLDEAVAHINRYGSGHTDGIVTNRIDWAQRFCDAVDSASIMVNASTRLSGGGDYGLGAVVGISTGKLHARGPVGPDDLTSTKWIASGQGHLRQ